MLLRPPRPDSPRFPGSSRGGLICGLLLGSTPVDFSVMSFANGGGNGHVSKPHLREESVSMRCFLWTGARAGARSHDTPSTTGLVGVHK